MCGFLKNPKCLHLDMPCDCYTFSVSLQTNPGPTSEKKQLCGTSQEKV